MTSLLVSASLQGQSTSKKVRPKQKQNKQKKGLLISSNIPSSSSSSFSSISPFFFPLNTQSLGCVSYEPSVILEDETPSPPKQEKFNAFPGVRFHNVDRETKKTLKKKKGNNLSSPLFSSPLVFLFSLSSLFSFLSSFFSPLSPLRRQHLSPFM
jgi:hypothetical protein